MAGSEPAHEGSIPSLAVRFTIERYASLAPSSRGLGRRPLKAETGIRIPLGLRFNSSALER
jgi:hypothetical protein